MKKILITGSEGKVGKDVKKFLAPYYEILELEKGEKLSPAKFKGVHALLHFAALTPRNGKHFTLEEYLEANVELTKHVLCHASKHHVALTIIPTSWSWMFKTGPYQYSKLIQEKVADAYKKLGLNVVLLELPEVVHNDYQGVIHSIMENIKNNRQTIVDKTNVTTITTQDLANVCKEFIEGREKLANSLFGKSLITFDLYSHIKDMVEEKFPGKLGYLKAGQTKITAPIVGKNDTIIFPDFNITQSNY